MLAADQLLFARAQRLRIVARDGISVAMRLDRGVGPPRSPEMGVGSHETIRSGIDDVERRFGRLPSGRFPSRRSGGHRQRIAADRERSGIASAATHRGALAKYGGQNSGEYSGE